MTESPAELNDISALATELLDCPIAAISLVTASGHAIEAAVGAEAAMLQPGIDFCERAIADRAGALVVTGASVDERFGNNPLVDRRPGIRFFAGVPLVGDGEAFGVLFVMDVESRTISARQLAALQRLARQAARLLELQRSWRDSDADNERHDAILRAMGEGLIMVEYDERGTVVVFNRAAEVIYGYRASEIVGKSAMRLTSVEESMSYTDYMAQYVRSDGTVLAEVEREGRRKDGTLFPVHVYFTLTTIARKKHIVAVVTDITERKREQVELVRSRQQLEKTVKALRQSIRDLDQFTYIASHDLKEPLRGICHLVSWLEEDADDPEARQAHVDRIRTLTARLQNLLDDLRAYSRVGRREEKIKQLDLNSAIRELFLLLQPPDGFEICFSSPMPELTTVVAPLETVFRNLIGNAIKHHDRERGEICIAAQDLGEFYEFTVIDDGPGIPEEHRERVFEPFTTLRPRDKVEGGGLGLSLVKKTVECYGGTIALGSNEPRGARLTFSWPKGIDQQSVADTAELLNGKPPPNQVCSEGNSTVANQ